MAGLQLAPGLRLDPDYVGGGTFALLAKKGWGKTYAMRVLAEEMHKAGVPFVALDPMDAFWGLRSARDGKAKGGLDIPIFGGEHADVPLEPTAGALMADLVVEEGLSMVLSIAHFGSRSKERRFALDFLSRLYRTNRDLVHLLIDEADLFAPQRPQAGDQQLLGETENIVRRGRNKGIGITLGTQRPAVLNKDVLTQVDGLIVGRMLGPQDRNAIDAWVGEHGDTKQGKAIKDELPDLKTGEAWVWVPELGVLKKVVVREARTFDSSPTRKRDSKRRSLKLADVDLDAIAGKVADTIERAKAEDPKELRKQIAELQATVSKMETETPEAPPAPDPIEVEVLVLGPEMAEDLEAGAKRLGEQAGKLTSLAERMQSQVDEARAIASNGRPAPPAPPPRPPARPGPPPAPRREPSPGPAPVPLESLSGAQQKVLDAVAWWEQIGYPEPTKLQVGIIAGYRVGKKVGGTYASVLGSLRTAGLIDYPQPSKVALLPDGREAASPADVEQSVAGLQRAIHARLAPTESKVLQVVIDRYPDSLTKREVGEQSGYQVGEKVGGTFASVVGRLRTLGLVDYPAPGLVVADPVLFLQR